ncbi:drug/metabolite transporter (DMT)-like permease [Maritalea mobilis]|uniref:Drug/metabolite transporter (DMT)-like permease n=1 Tax=Maritalea mobilis TaxID=483324 RepID=A0A4R6VVW1_9HYPH|nr:DMT family transporter [Maritalea mobilis]TDQ66926.1 drug/metabolite transporter (DMT)-like permease [Maritalea mobilis]
MSVFQVPDDANVAKGISLTLIAILVFGVQDVAVKFLVTDYPFTQVVMIRFWGVGLFILAWLWREGTLRTALKSKAPYLQLTRATLLVVDIWCFSAALSLMPLADLQAIFMLFPIVTTLLAIPMLGEQVGLVRWMAIIVGFIGTMIVIRPGFQDLNLGVFFQLGAVFSFAGYTILTRMVSSKDRTSTSLAYMALVGIVLSTAVGFRSFEIMTPQALMLMGLIIITANIAHTLFTMALREAPASILQPFNFLMLPVAIVFSFIAFGDLIDSISLIGASITVGAGLTVWWRERQKKIRTGEDIRGEIR